MSDLSALVAIEKETQADPWTAVAFKTCFEAGYDVFGCKQDACLVGFIVFSVTMQECHILNLGIIPRVQRRGVGYALLQDALARAEALGAQMAYLEVRASNAPAIALYKKASFESFSVRKNYYPTKTGREDALLFARPLSALGRALR